MVINARTANACSGPVRAPLRITVKKSSTLRHRAALDQNALRIAVRRRSISHLRGSLLSQPYATVGITAPSASRS